MNKCSRIMPLLLFFISWSYTLLGQSPVRIMALGNSITQADNTHLGYRYRLWSKLNAANVDFDMVGSMRINFNGNPVFPDNNFDPDHEGHWGWRADELLSGLPAWLTGYTPDIVLMHVGTNDILQGQSVEGTIGELSAIIDALRTDNSTVTILLAKLIGTSHSQNVSIIALNNQINTLAAEKNTVLSKVQVVDQYTGFTPSTDTYDGIHPDEQGEEKMAQKWFDGIITLTTSDATPPTVPSGLASSNITSTSFTLSWNSSTDAIGVTGYEIFKNGISVALATGTSIAVNAGLTPATAYTMTVRARDAAGNWSALSNGLNVMTSGASNPNNGNGLQAQYYNTRNLTGPVVHNIIDPQVNFDWGTSAPATGVNAENFSVRWTGKVESPVSGNYIFSTLSDDGVRLSINGVQVINNWTDHGPTMNNSAAVQLTAGVKYDVLLEYYENSIGAVIRLLWTYPGQSQQPIPQTRLYTPAPSGEPDVQAPSVPTGLNATNISQTSFTISWSASSDAVGVTGYEVFRNGIFAGTTGGTSLNISGLTPGTIYAMSARARDAAGNWSSQSAVYNVTTAQPSNTSGTGLTAEYYNSRNLSGPVIVNKIDPQVNFDWGSNAPIPNINADNFSVRWTGKVEAVTTGNYVFSTLSDDGVRLWLGSTLIINNWTDHGPVINNSTALALTAGTQYDIRLEYYENGYGAVIGLLWSYGAQSQQPIPQSRLLPLSAGGGDTQTPSSPFGLTSSNITQNSFTLSWNAANDNIGVTGYEVFRDGLSSGIATGTNFNITSGLSAGTTYAMTVRARDAAGNWSDQSTPLNVTTLQASGDPTLNGLLANYYNNVSLSPPIAITRTDAFVNFDWLNGSPSPSVTIDFFSVRWVGLVEAPVTGNYTFATTSDDGIRLWINNTQVINNWTDHGPTTNFTVSIPLVTGQKYNLQLEYYERTSGAVAKLLWAYPGQPQQIIPASRLFLPSSSARTSFDSRIGTYPSIENDITGYDDESELIIYSQPVTTDFFTMKIHSRKKANTMMRLTSMQGIIVLSSRIEIEEGDNIIEIPLGQISDGIYIVGFDSISRTLHKKVIVKRQQ